MTINTPHWNNRSRSRLSFSLVRNCFFVKSAKCVSFVYLSMNLKRVVSEQAALIEELRAEIAALKAETILVILQARFRRVLKETEKIIRQMTDPVVMDSWAVHAATCPSMDEFTKALK